jgi:hypothetical protein
MKVLGTQTIELSSLSNQAEIVDRLAEPRIKDRAESIDRLVMLNDPIVRQSDMRLLAGRDRAAAHVLLKRAMMVVKLVECTDLEAEKIEDEENLQRRHDPAEQAMLTARMVARYATEAAALHDIPPTTSRKGRPKGSTTAVGMARERVAKAKGVKKDSVRRQQNRAKQKEAGVIVAAAEKKAPIVPKDPPIRLLGVDKLGLEFDPAFFAGVFALQGYLREAASKVRGAQMALTQLKNAEVPYRTAELQRLAEEAHDLHRRLKDALPSTICPHCKCLSGIQEACVGCVTLGWITTGQEGGVPKELWAEGDAAVVQYQGNLVPVNEVVPRQAAEPEAAEEDIFT